MTSFQFQRPSPDSLLLVNGFCEGVLIDFALDMDS